MPPPIEFSENEECQLVLHHARGMDANTGAPDGAVLAAQAAAAGFGELLLDAPALDAAAKRIVAGEEFSGVVGKRTNAEYRVDVAPDKMAANLTVAAAHGGVNANVADAIAALAQHSVVFGIDEAALTAALATPGVRTEVAHGQRPQSGTDGRMEPLIEVNQTRHPHEDEKGHIDFRDLGLVRSVGPDTPLMRRHPPLLGVPGSTVTGTELMAAKPKDVKFPVRLEGVHASAADPDLLVATVAGQPVVHRDGISVEPILVLQTVDLATGNVDFVGTVEIKGDVQSGMEIKAGGDVIVHGILESAEIEAGGDVVVHGGIIGQKNAMHGHAGEKKTGGARIHAKANIRAHHVENAFILAEQSVYVDEAIIQSDITAIDQVVVGKEGGRKGHILGGIVRATLGVTAECLGGPGTGETRILIGVNPLLQKTLNEKRAIATAKLKEHGDLEKAVKVLQGRPDRQEILEKVHLTLARTEEELAEAMADAHALEAEIKQADHAEIIVKRNVFPGVLVIIGHRRTMVTEQRGPGTFRLVTETINGKEEELVAYQ